MKSYLGAFSQPPKLNNLSSHAGVTGKNPPEPLFFPSSLIPLASPPQLLLSVALFFFTLFSRPPCPILSPQALHPEVVRVMIIEKSNPKKMQNSLAREGVYNCVKENKL